MKKKFWFLKKMSVLFQKIKFHLHFYIQCVSFALWFKINFNFDDCKSWFRTCFVLLHECAVKYCFEICSVFNHLLLLILYNIGSGGGGSWHGLPLKIPSTESKMFWKSELKSKCLENRNQKVLKTQTEINQNILKNEFKNTSKPLLISLLIADY